MADGSLETKKEGKSKGERGGTTKQYKVMYC